MTRAFASSKPTRLHLLNSQLPCSRHSGRPPFRTVCIASCCHGSSLYSIQPHSPLTVPAAACQRKLPRLVLWLVQSSVMHGCMHAQACGGNLLCTPGRAANRVTAMAGVAEKAAGAGQALKRSYSSMWIGEGLDADYGADTAQPPKNRRAGGEGSLIWLAAACADHQHAHLTPCSMHRGRRRCMAAVHIRRRCLS